MKTIMHHTGYKILVSSGYSNIDGIYINRTLCLLCHDCSCIRPIHTVNKKWCIESLVQEFKGIEHSAHRNFHIHSLVPHQGMIIFKNPNEKLGHQIVPMSAGHNHFRTIAFMDLPARARGSDIVFSIKKHREPRCYTERYLR